MLPCSCRYPVADVHRIGILDIRLFNTDRHAGNLLVKVSKAPKPAAYNWLEKEYSLIPIDHGFCLPEALEPPYFEWLHWPQVCTAQIRQTAAAFSVRDSV